MTLQPFRPTQDRVSLVTDDIRDLLDSSPDVIIAGTGVNGRMKPDENLVNELSNMAIEFIAGPNEKAIRLFNRLVSERRVGACFHLTC